MARFLDYAAPGAMAAALPVTWHDELLERPGTREAREDFSRLARGG